MRSLTEGQWERYFELVERLERLPPDQRRRGFSELQADVDFDVFALVGLHLDLTPDIDRCRTGDRIGNLVLAERIGCGGMGAVYRATQSFSDGIERQVAVKLIDPGLILHEPELSHRRFRTEIGTLAKLEHKGIARIYDGGRHRSHDRGEESLYFSMELVDGKPLTDYAAEHGVRLGIRGMLRLFLLVCDAVAYAHRRGVIHCDLKPANILVDTRGEPRVIDFGLADMLGNAALGDRAGLVCGTPAYMSPEQLSGDPVAPTPATDVYALGITLAELFSGRPDGRAGAIADPALAAIVTRATEERPGDRYPSVAALGEALARRLEAIEADQDALQRTRRTLIGHVRTFWIDGVLGHSLHAAPSIELALTQRPDAVEHPWDLVVQRPDRSPRALPPGKPIAEVFEAAGRSLLILGAPGAGKTTLLLELAAALLDRANEDATRPVPVVLHLSTWADRRLPFADWLVDELDKRYAIPPGASRTCLAGNHLVLLLDGLDEVAPAHRPGCVDAVNTFCRQHADVRLAVCSRLADCEALPARLQLAQAVVIQALTRRQIDDYLQLEAPCLAGVRAASRHDEALRDMLSTPLLLSIGTLAYEQGPPAIPSGGTPAQRHAQLFAAYAEAMFRRRGPVRRYSPERSTRWLGWLATAMLAHHQSVFYLEWMQPDWLPRPLERWAAGGGVVVLCGLLTGLIVGMGGHFAGAYAYALPVSLVFGLVGGLAFGFTDWGERIRPVTRLGWSLSALRQGAGSKLARAAGVGLLLHFGVSLVLDRATGIAVGLTASLAFCYFAGLDLHPALDDSGRITAPNEGIRQSLRNAMRGSFVGALIGAVAAFVTGRLPGMLFLVPLFGLIAALIAGAYPCLQHLILRLLLWRKDCAPWRYAEFLDFAAERILVHRVGGGYAFVHRALLEYFAGLHAARDGQGSRPSRTD
jgi:serine/threonine protein kinase